MVDKWKNKKDIKRFTWREREDKVGLQYSTYVKEEGKIVLFEKKLFLRTKKEIFFSKNPIECNRIFN